MKLTVVLLGLLVLIVTAVILNGFVFSYLWLWFAVPIGAPPISVPLAIGLCMLIRNPVSDMKTDSSNDFGGVMVQSFGGPLVALAVGFLIHLFV